MRVVQFLDFYKWFCFSFELNSLYVKKYYSITFNKYNIIIISKTTSTSILGKALMSGALPVVFNDLFLQLHSA